MFYSQKRCPSIMSEQEKFPGNELRQKIIAKLNADEKFSVSQLFFGVSFHAKNITLNKSMFGSLSASDIIITINPTFPESRENGFVQASIMAFDPNDESCLSGIKTMFEGWLESEIDLDHVLRMLGVPVL